MSIYAYAIAALIIFLAGAGAAHRYDTGQYAIKENARLEQVREQEKAARATERAQANNVITAQNEARKRESVALAAASNARTELGRLRSALAAATATRRRPAAGGASARAYGLSGCVRVAVHRALPCRLSNGM